MIYRLLLLLFIACAMIGNAQSHSPKYEFRAVWVATVANIDWPSQPGLSSAQQQEEVIGILDMHRKLGMNAVILQIRPASDAFYPSELEPWSRYLSGTPGKAPEPFYDPLAFWIEEAHKRGMEFHAWMNPFRVSLNHSQPLAASHVAFRHPEWILKYGNSLYFDPGLPQTRTYVAEVVKDVVARYDVDAIHFDDYFYPYPLAEDFPDTASFAMFKRGYFLEQKADWRRENVDMMIQLLNTTIKSVKPWVKFGISPFGVWRNRSDDPLGSETRAGATNYDHLYANIIKWQENGWIDYSLPQLYWQIGHPQADFRTLARWWQNHAYGRGMYIGLGLYKCDPQSSVFEWTQPGELPRQIKLIREIPGLGGAALYSSKHFSRDLLGFPDSLMTNLYKHPALVPPMTWIDEKPPMPVSRFRKSGRTIKWKRKDSEHELEKPRGYIIYLYEKGQVNDPGNPGNIHMMVGKDQTRMKLERINSKRRKYEVRVSVYNRLSNESMLSHPVTVKL